MDLLPEGCRLCLDSYGECFTTIDNPQLKNQMEKVFCFSIEPKQGYCYGVCQSCSYAISEFYQYSEKVRQNQEILNGNVANCDPTVASKIMLQHEKFGTYCDSGLLETADGPCKPKSNVLEEEISTVHSKITLETVKLETLSDSVLPKTTEYSLESKDAVLKEEVINSDDDESFVPTMDSIVTLESVKLEALSDSELTEIIAEACKPRDEVTVDGDISTENSNVKLERIKIEMPCDLVLPETTKDANESTDELSKKEEFSNSGEYESFEPLPKKSQTERKRRPGKRELDDSDADEPKTNSLPTCFKTLQMKQIERDQIIRTHIPMICELCGTAMATFVALRSHFRTAHNNQNGYVVCCNKKLFKRGTILDHIKFHTNPDAFRCDVCGNKYKNKITLNEHMLCKHSNAGTVCSQCNKVFACKRYLTYHMANKHSGKDQTMVCKFCGKVLKNERNLRDHLNTVHIHVDRKFQCDICPQKYTHSRALYFHKVREHAERQARGSLPVR